MSIIVSKSTFKDKINESYRDNIWYHGTASNDLRGGVNGLHVGTYKAATQALEATIGIPAQGTWDGTRTYGETLLAGKKNIVAMGKYITGQNCHAPDEDYYIKDSKRPPNFSNKQLIPLDCKPTIFACKIIGPMSNTLNNPYDDFRANGMMRGQLKKGNARKGYYYTNVGEDAGSISAVLPSASHIEIVNSNKIIDEEITAFHGGPHHFKKFSTDKIGTGEGNQSFGWGLYFTDLESIARNYATALPIENRVINDIAKRTLQDNNNDRNLAIKSLEDDLKETWSDKKRVSKALNVLKTGKFLNVKKTNLYQVSLHKGKTPEQYDWLEWYKPLSKIQIEKLTKALKAELVFPYAEATIRVNIGSGDYKLINTRKGAETYNQLSRLLGNDKNASLFLLENGIDGIKYPAESIARNTTSDTARGFNYVVFDENAISIQKQTKLEEKIITKSEFNNKLEENNDWKPDYLKWKRKNVTLRGITNPDGPLNEPNNAGARFGSGLYTAFLSNSKMAKEYGKVYFVLNAIPKTPKIVNDANQAEIFLQNVIDDWCKEHNNGKYDSNYFFKNTNIADEMLNIGFDGLVVRGREMVNYKPENIKYFETEDQLIRYYEDYIEPYLEKKQTFESILTEEVKLNEARHLNVRYRFPNMPVETPLKDNEVIRVYHGFNRFDEGLYVSVFGLSGKERTKRIYSYEYGNNPKGLFVTVDFDTIKRAGFAHGGLIIEFSARMNELEAPVWVGGRSYFVQGEYTQSFKDNDEREQQRLKNRERDSSHLDDKIRNSDRPELAQTIFDNYEKQALFIGDLNPNRITAVWYNERLHKDRRTDGEWIKYSRKDFIRLFKNQIEKNTQNLEHSNSIRHSDRLFKPEDNFDEETFKNALKVKWGEGAYDRWLKFELDKKFSPYWLTQYFWPKQMEQASLYYKEKYGIDSEPLNENVIKENYETISQLNILTTEVLKKLAELNTRDIAEATNDSFRGDHRIVDGNYSLTCRLGSIDKSIFNDKIQEFITNYKTLPIEIQYKDSIGDAKAIFLVKSDLITVSILCYLSINDIQRYFNDRINENIDTHIVYIFFHMYLYDSLLHELQHAYDFYISNGKAIINKQSEKYFNSIENPKKYDKEKNNLTDFKSSQEFKNLKNYHQQTHEINAWFTATINKIKPFIYKDFIEHKGQPKVLYSKEKLSIFLKKFIQGFRNVYYYLSTNDKRKVLKRATKYYYDIIDNFKKNHPDQSDLVYELQESHKGVYTFDKSIIKEARSNPHINLPIDSFKRFIDVVLKNGIENCFVSFREDLYLTTMNPDNVYNTPLGFYSYPISEYINKENLIKLNDFENFSMLFPYGNNRRYVKLFILKNKSNVIDIRNGTDSPLIDLYVDKINNLYGHIQPVKNMCNDMKNRVFTTNYLANPNSNIQKFWLFLYEIVPYLGLNYKSRSNSVTVLCWKIGLNGFIDNGTKFIHSAEPRQAVFFNVKGIGVFYDFDKFKNYDQQNTIYTYDYQIKKEKLLQTGNLTKFKEIVLSANKLNISNKFITLFKFLDNYDKQEILVKKFHIIGEESVKKLLDNESEKSKFNIFQPTLIQKIVKYSHNMDYLFLFFYYYYPIYFLNTISTNSIIQLLTEMKSEETFKTIFNEETITMLCKKQNTSYEVVYIMLFMFIRLITDNNNLKYYSNIIFKNQTFLASFFDFQITFVTEDYISKSFNKIKNSFGDDFLDQLILTLLDNKDSVNPKNISTYNSYFIILYPFIKNDKTMEKLVNFCGVDNIVDVIIYQIKNTVFTPRKLSGIICSLNDNKLLELKNKLGDEDFTTVKNQIISSSTEESFIFKEKLTKLNIY